MLTRLLEEEEVACSQPGPGYPLLLLQVPTFWQGLSVSQLESLHALRMGHGSAHLALPLTTFEQSPAGLRKEALSGGFRLAAASGGGQLNPHPDEGRLAPLWWGGCLPGEQERQWASVLPSTGPGGWCWGWEGAVSGPASSFLGKRPQSVRVRRMLGCHDRGW